MKVDKTQITGVQFMFSVICFIQSSALLTAFLSDVVMQDSWLVVLFAMILNIPLILLFKELMVMFPNLNLLQILEEVFGKAVGKILGAAYIWFFFTLTSLNLMDLGDFTKMIIMKKTPNMALLIVFLLLCAMTVRHGAKIVTRYSIFFATIKYVLLIIDILFLIDQIDLQNILPVLNLPPVKYAQGVSIISSIPLGEVVVFLMIAPNVKLTRKETTKYLLWGYILGTIAIAIVTFRDAAVLGNAISIYTIPSLISLRLVNIGTAISRIEILFSIAFIMLYFFKVTFLYFISVVAFAYFFKIKAYRRIVLAAGAFILFYGLTLYPNSVVHITQTHEVVSLMWMPFNVLIPLITFIVAKARKLPAGGKENVNNKEMEKKCGDER